MTNGKFNIFRPCSRSSTEEKEEEINFFTTAII